ncbi:MAG TPA: hypothetical protein VJ870_19305 [Amycolatopsis sp.]|nr:hypothetical protein [Amycolatopsis sp.]
MAGHRKTPGSLEQQVLTALAAAGTRDHVVALREDVAQVLAPMGRRLSPAKTRIVHIRDGFDFLGFRIPWRIKKGIRDQGRLYTFRGDRPLRWLKARIRALTRRTSQQDLRAVSIRINRITRGWLNTSGRRGQAHLRPARLLHLVANRALGQDQTALEMEGRSPLAANPDGVAADRRGRDRTAQHRNIAATPVTRYRRRSIPSPWPCANHA